MSVTKCNSTPTCYICNNKVNYLNRRILVNSTNSYTICSEDICMQEFLKKTPIPCSTCGKPKTTLGCHALHTNGSVKLYCNAVCLLKKMKSVS